MKSTVEPFPSQISDRIFSGSTCISRCHGSSVTAQGQIPSPVSVDVEPSIPAPTAIHGGSTGGSRHLTKLRCVQQSLDSDSHCQDKALLGAVHGTCQALIQPFHKSLQPFPERLQSSTPEWPRPAGSTFIPE